MKGSADEDLQTPIGAVLATLQRVTDLGTCPACGGSRIKAYKRTMGEALRLQNGKARFQCVECGELLRPPKKKRGFVGIGIG
jgi:hypothetical protein